MKKKKAEKRHSIRIQFALIFIGLLTGVFLIFWLINNLFLQKYYLQNKQGVIESSFSEIDRLFQLYEPSSSEELRLAFAGICSERNLNVVVVSPSFDTLITSDQEDDILIYRLMDHLFQDGLLETEAPREQPGRKEHRRTLKKTEDYEIQISDDPRMRMMDYMELWGSLSGGDMIYMRTPLASIRESVKISNRFFLYIGCIMAVVGGIVIWVVSGRITRPVLGLAKLSEKMAGLDFEARYTGKETNEIGILGNRMNELSATLEHTISELKTANNELKRDIEIKDRQNSMRLEFLSNVAHELKTPVALIQGYAEGLKDNIHEDAESREFYCDVIVDESQKINQMVKNLTTLNQLEFGQDEITMEHFNLTELIENSVLAADILLKSAEISLRFSGGDPIYVWADEFRIEEVFTNYLSNAIHYCAVPEGGSEKYIDVGLLKKDNLVRVCVFNTGKPIPAESLERLWDKFYKVDKARTHEYGGSGIGLSIVKAVMEAHGREYGVENRENGVMFWFELDCENPA